MTPEKLPRSLEKIVGEADRAFHERHPEIKERQLYPRFGKRDTEEALREEWNQLFMDRAVEVSGVDPLEAISALEAARRGEVIVGAIDTGG